MKSQIILALLIFLEGVLTARSIHIGPQLLVKNIHEAVSIATSGDTVYVYEGVYHEGNLLLDKSISLIGIGFPVLDGLFQGEIITITAPNVLIKGFQIQNSGILSTIDLAGIKVLATEGVTLDGNRIYACNFGIYLSNTKHCSIRNNDIHGTPTEEQNTGNGIHLWKCSAAKIEYNYSTGHRDGIYFEFVTNTEIRGNLSEGNRRYGLHFMFSNNDNYTDNIFRNNGSGVAVMYSRQVHMYRNQFENNWGSASYGILLKDISDSHIKGNFFNKNSNGIYLEGASRIVIEENVFHKNGWALRVQASCDGNTIRSNNFYGNSFDVSTNGHLVLNSFEGNYWDKYEGYDLDHNHIGDVPFRPVTLYAVVVERMPYGLVLMRSFMVFLLDKAEKMMPSITPEKLLDEKPLMTPFILPTTPNF
jgi:nitrous oxidase accessory protein